MKILFISLLIHLLFIANVFANTRDGLVDWWKLDEGTGTTAADVGSNAVVNNLNGTPTWIFNTPRSTGISFNGTSQSLKSSATVGLNTTNVITIVFWMWENSFGNTDALAFESSANFNSTNGTFIVDPNATGGPSGCASGTFDFAASDGTSSNFNYFHFTRPSSATWHHYALIIYMSNAVGSDQAYVDGQSVTTTGCHTANLSGNFTNQTLNSMSRNNASLWNAGRLDDVRIYNRALTAQEVADLYNAGILIKGNGTIIQGIKTKLNY